MVTSAVVLAPMSPFGSVAARCLECEHASETRCFCLGQFVNFSAPICSPVVADVSLNDQMLNHFSSPILFASFLRAFFLRLQERDWVQLQTGALCAHLHRI